MIAYKYRANLFDKEDGFRRDTKFLLNNELFASPFRDQNDPFEASVDLPSEYKHDWVTPIKQDIYTIGIYSLSKQKTDEEFPSNELLWAHYANSHKGFCIEYDLDLLKDNRRSEFDIRNLINIKYVKERPVVEENDELFARETKVFGTKSQSWKYENEVRLVFKTNGVKKIAKGAIKGIYFGLNMGLEERNSIIKGLKDNDITFHQIERVGNTYKLIANKLVNNDYSNYVIIGTKHNSNVENYHILYKGMNKDKNSIIEFVSGFRSVHPKPLNISIYDDRCVETFMYDYPIKDENQKLLAKHWLAFSSFDAPDVVWMYPEK